MARPAGTGGHFSPRENPLFRRLFFSSQKPTATTVMATFFPPRLWPARISAGQSAERLPIFHSSSSSTHTLFVFFFYPVGKSGFGRGRKKRFREANLVCESRKNRADYGPRHPAGTETAGTWGIASFFLLFSSLGDRALFAREPAGTSTSWSGLVLSVCLAEPREEARHTPRRNFIDADSERARAVDASRRRMLRCGKRAERSADEAQKFSHFLLRRGTVGLCCVGGNAIFWGKLRQKK